MVRRLAKRAEQDDARPLWPPCPAPRQPGPSCAFYDKKRGERLIHIQALLALARRLVDVLWVLRVRRPDLHPRRTAISQ
jgi:hypothetical protein